MEIQKTTFPDAFILIPKVFHDDRGYFYEVYHKEKFHAIGLNVEFVQDNLSLSKKGVLRGMHLQQNPHQGKLVRAVQGDIFDVIVDIKRDSPTFGQWFGVELSDENHQMLWVPEGFAHGFLTLSATAVVEYKCTGLYSPVGENTIRYYDPDIGIKWPSSDIILAEKDRQGMTLKEWSESPQFVTFNDTLPPSLKLNGEVK